MTQVFQCGDNTMLVGYLYDECALAERLAIETHVKVCAACAAELAALGSTRAQLASWTPPEVELGLQVVAARALGASARRASDGPGTLEPEADTRSGAWWRQPLPAWAQAAAALLIFATGLSLGVVRGTAQAPAQAPVAAAAAREAIVSAPLADATAPSAGDLAALEQRLREEISQIRIAAPAPAAPATADAQLFARVRALIEESEQRQQRELALRTAQIVRDFDSQRRVDLAQIQRTVGQIEGLTGAEVREQRQMLNYLIRTSQQR